MNADRIALIIVSAIAVLFAFHNYQGANAQTPQTPQSTLRTSLSSSFVGVQAVINGSPGAGIWLIGSDLTLRFCHIVAFDQAPSCSPPIQPR